MLPFQRIYTCKLVLFTDTYAPQTLRRPCIAFQHFQRIGMELARTFLTTLSWFRSIQQILSATDHSILSNIYQICKLRTQLLRPARSTHTSPLQCPKLHRRNSVRGGTSGASRAHAQTSPFWIISLFDRNAFFEWLAFD